MKKELRFCEALLKLIMNYLFENWVGKRKQLIIVFSKRNRPKQGAEGASVSSDARRLCDGGGQGTASAARGVRWDEKRPHRSEVF